MHYLMRWLGIHLQSCKVIFLFIPALVSLLQCTAPMSQALSQPTPQQAPHPVPQQLPHPSSQPVTQRQEMMSSTETIGQSSGEAAPNPLPFPANTLRSSSPKPDASELYLKSKAMLDSKRE